MTKEEFIKGIQRRAKELKESGHLDWIRKPKHGYHPKPIVIEEITEEQLEKELEKIELLEEDKDKEKDERDDNSI